MTEKKVCAYLLGAVVGGVLLHDDAVHLHHVRLHEILVAQLFLADLAVATTAKNRICCFNVFKWCDVWKRY